ncbi:unnamed protein product [Parnassius mnemosyne]|uniref:CCHC-type domain-containing protein n=1 Tax=Parnassius mnemosyne TaxID=213953 RepID=A0AAV1L292_9NEOP
MPPRKPRNNDSSSDEEPVNPTPVAPVNPTPAAPVLMSKNQISSLLAAFSVAQTEANRKLVQSLLTSHLGAPPNVDSSAAGAATVTSLRSSSIPGTFVKCTARFDGSSQHPEAVEAFIDAVEMYKDCASVSDEMALRGLPMLLQGDAAVWWRGIRNEVHSWSDAVKCLRLMYGVPRPAYKLYRDVFAAKQGSGRADILVVKLRALLAKLPYELPEEARLDMIYGLLHKRIRKRLSRDTVNDIESLTERSRAIEESLSENAAMPPLAPPQPSASPLSVPARSSRRHGEGAQHSTSGSSLTAPQLRTPVSASQSSRDRAPAPRSDQCVSKTSDGEKKLFCVYCKTRGHVRDSCDKLNKRSHSSNSGIVYYNCGDKGHIRVNCPKCLRSIPSNDNVKVENVFSSIFVSNCDSSSKSDCKEQGRPIVRVSTYRGILGYRVVR